MTAKKKEPKPWQFKTDEYYEQNGLLNPRKIKKRKPRKKLPSRKKKTRWDSDYEHDPEKRVWLRPCEKIYGPPELKVVWDEGQKFLKHIKSRVLRLKMTKKESNRRVYWEEFLEAKYDLRMPLAAGRYPTLGHKRAVLRNRAARKLARKRGLERLRQTAYGFLPPSEILSTIPT